MFRDKVCVVTGGANGIGRCIVYEFAQQGAKVLFIDMDKNAGEEVLFRIKSNGGEGLFIHGDISEKHVLECSAKVILETYGKIDYLINKS